VLFLYVFSTGEGLECDFIRVERTDVECDLD